MSVSTMQASIIAIWIALVQARFLFGGASTVLRFTPMMTSLVCGIVFNDIVNGLKIGAAIQLIYMGALAPGGQAPTEPAVATGIAVPVALLGGMSPAAATAIAVPVGILGGYLYQFRFFVNTFIMQKFTDKYAKEGNDKGLTFSIIGLPTLAAIAIYFPFMFIALHFGAPAIAGFVNSASGTLVFHVLDVVGGGLVSIGIAVTVYVIGKKKYIPFFLLAFFMAIVSKKLGITMVTYAAIGILIACIYIVSRTEKGNSTPSEEEPDDDY